MSLMNFENFANNPAEDEEFWRRLRAEQAGTSRSAQTPVPFANQGAPAWDALQPATRQPGTTQGGPSWDPLPPAPLPADPYGKSTQTPTPLANQGSPFGSMPAAVRAPAPTFDTSAQTSTPLANQVAPPGSPQQPRRAIPRDPGQAVPRDPAAPNWPPPDATPPHSGLPGPPPVTPPAPAAAPFNPGAAPPGFDAGKWADPTHLSDKYRAGRMVATGATAEQVATELGAGWKVLSPDAVQAPDGSVFDIYFDYGGPQQRPQWTQISGPGGAPLGGQGGAGGASGASLGSPWLEYMSSGDPSVGYGNNPSTEIYLNEVLSRLQQLREPINDPYRGLYEQYSLDRVRDLGGANQASEQALREYEQMARNRMASLPGGAAAAQNEYARYEAAAMGRVAGLDGDPYTSGEDAALRARYMDPLAHARDAAQTAAKERTGARGMLSSSGLHEDSMQEIDKGYQQAVGSASNDLAVRAIDEKQRRADQQLAILNELLGQGRTTRAEGHGYADQGLNVMSDLLGEGRTSRAEGAGYSAQQLGILESLLGESRNVRAEDNARSVELLQTSSLLPEMDERRLQLLLQASGEGGGSPSSIMSSLMGLGQLGLTQQQIAQGNRQNSSAAWGSMLPYLLQALGLGG